MITPYKPKRILFVQHGATVMGGVERLLLQISGSYRDRGIESIVVLPEDGELVTRLNAIGIKTYIIPSILFPGSNNAGINLYLAGTIERAQAVLQIIKDEAIDIVHTNTVYPFDGALAAKMANIPHIWHVHSNFDIDTTPTLLKAYNLSDQAIRALYAALCDTLVGVSSRTLKFFEGDPRISSRVILNALKIDEFDHKTLSQSGEPNLRDLLKINTNDPIVGFVGRICDQKEPLTFVRAAKLISEKNPEAHFVIIGPPDDKTLKKLVEDEICRSRNPSHFHFLGEREDVPALLPQLSVILITSIFEGLAGVCLEALAARCPTVSTRCGGSEDVIVDGENGFLVDIGDYEAIAQQALRIIEDPELSNNLKISGRKIVEKNFSWECFIDNFIALYSELLKKNNDRQKSDPALELCFHLIAQNAALNLKLEAHNSRLIELEGFFERLQNSNVYRLTKYIYKILGGHVRS
ncbi:glycosyltransferase family 4 protein [Methylomonas sp. TEB]|uniref:glycosyltransferase family 4 protein n=1 Tax=Methylomonas sp. TEB TaxID=3398229 RepID=UPI0039F45C2E